MKYLQKYLPKFEEQPQKVDLKLPKLKKIQKPKKVELPKLKKVNLMERVIVCPVCGDEHSCFEDVQETFKSYMCFTVVLCPIVDTQRIRYQKSTTHHN